ncbi:MAG TPA: DUF5655 domain-containing protein [Blastocatellia bacterium]|nr:DUF5655 domain-containing protein [Blastocatellia bacterium]
MAKTASKSAYTLHPGFKMQAAYERNLKDRTGKTLEEWVAIVKKSGPATLKERAAWLKETFGITTNYANWIAECVDGKGTADSYDPESYVDNMFSGPKAALRPIYDQLLKLGFKLGKDVTVTPCSTIVPIRRKHVIAQIKPSTNTRIDLGYALGATNATGRLIDTGGYAKKDRITHRIPITSLEEIDDEVKHWLKVAYEMDA